MKRVPQRNRSVSISSSRNGGVLPQTRPNSTSKENTKTKPWPKLSKRLSVHVSVTPKETPKNASTASKVQEPQQQYDKQNVIDLSKHEDVEKMVAQLVALLGSSLQEDFSTEFGTSMPVCGTVFTTSLFGKKQLNCKKTNPMPRNATVNKLKFYKQLKNDTEAQQSSSQTQIKLPFLKPEQLSLFEVKYSQPMNFKSLQNKLQKLQPKPCSLASFVDRGRSSTSIRARETRETQIRPTLHSRIMTFPLVSSRDGTIEAKSRISNLSRGKSKAADRYSVTFMDDLHGERNGHKYFTHVFKT